MIFHLPPSMHTDKTSSLVIFSCSLDMYVFFLLQSPNIFLAVGRLTKGVYAHAHVRGKSNTDRQPSRRERQRRKKEANMYRREEKNVMNIDDGKVSRSKKNLFC